MDRPSLKSQSIRVQARPQENQISVLFYLRRKINCRSDNKYKRCKIINFEGHHLLIMFSIYQPLNNYSNCTIITDRVQNMNSTCMNSISHSRMKIDHIIRSDIKQYHQHRKMLTYLKYISVKFVAISDHLILFFAFCSSFKYPFTNSSVNKDWTGIIIYYFI